MSLRKKIKTGIEINRESKKINEAGKIQYKVSYQVLDYHENIKYM